MRFHPLAERVALMAVIMLTCRPSQMAGEIYAGNISVTDSYSTGNAAQAMLENCCKFMMLKRWWRSLMVWVRTLERGNFKTCAGE